MTEVSIVVNGKAYRLQCDEGEEQHLHELADYVSRKVEAIKHGVGQVEDDRLLVMMALTITDELCEAKDQLSCLEVQVRAVAESSSQNETSALAQLSRNLEEAAEKIEALNAELAQTGSVGN